FGFSGSAREWHRYRIAYGLLGGPAAPLVISVRSVVSSDFATAIGLSLHTTIFPSFFVSVAFYFRFVMVFCLVIPIRQLHGLTSVIRRRHLELLGFMLLVTGSIVFYSYATEAYGAYLSGDRFERYTQFVYRVRGSGAPFYWMIVVCNGLMSQTFWIPRLRR